MNIKASYRYQLNENKYSIIIFYAILIFVYILLYTNAATQIEYVYSTTDASGRIISDTTTTHVGFGGMSVSTIIFIFIVSLNSFKGSFRMQMQNGLSRRTIFSGRIMTSFTVALVLAVVDQLLLLLFKAVTATTSEQISCSSVYEQTYLQRASEVNAFVLNIESLLFDFFLYLCFMSIGYFITILFYRLNTLGKTIVGAGTPITLFMLLPLADYYMFHGRISSALSKLADFAFGYSSNRPVNAMLSCMIVFTAFCTFSWLLIRKSPVKD